MVPAGHVFPKLRDAGPILAVPTAAITKVPDPPIEVVQETIAPGVPEIAKVLDEPGHRLELETDIIGLGVTVICEVPMFAHCPLRGVNV